MIRKAKAERRNVWGGLSLTQVILAVPLQCGDNSPDAVFRGLAYSRLSSWFCADGRTVRMSSDLEGFWLIYDGDCPVCRSTAHAFAIKKEYGFLNLVNARAAPDHQACKRARTEGLDLDEGMVIFADGAIYHGAGAISFLATFGAPASLLTRAGLMLHRSSGLSACVYRALRGLRNILLRLRGIGPIDNLHRSD